VSWVFDKLIDFFLWIVRLFRSRPRLSVEYASRGGSSSAGSPNKLTVRWHYRVTITNLSKEDALDLTVIRTNIPELEKLGVHHLKGLDHLELKCQLVKELDKETVVSARHDFHGVLEPTELKELVLVLRYKSDSGVTSYTSYTRSRENPNTWSFRQPKPV